MAEANDPCGPWTKYAGNPILEPTPGTEDADAVVVYSIIWNSVNQEWWMYYQGFQKVEGVNYSRIFLATSPDLINWTKQGKVLDLGSSDSWESQYVYAPSVLWDGTKYVMTYSGLKLRGRAAIGLATSNDGITWTKYSANPIFTGQSNAWDSTVEISSLTFINGQYVLLYEATGILAEQPLRGFRIGAAFSKDLINWTRLPFPILEHEFLFAGVSSFTWGCGHPYLLLAEDGRCFLYYARFYKITDTILHDIWVAEVDSSLLNPYTLGIQ